MIRSSLHSTPQVRIELFLLSLSSFALPLFQKVSIACWILMGVLALYKPKPIPNEGARFNFLLPAFFVLYLIAMLWTDNQKTGWNIITEKLSFLFLPLLFVNVSLRIEARDLVKASFVTGCFFNALLMLGVAIYDYSHTGDKMEFFYTNFASVLPHPTYISIYLNIALLILLEFYIGNRYPQVNSPVFISLSVFFFLILILLSSRMAQITTAFTFSAGIIYAKGKIPFRIARKYYALLLVLIAVIIYIGFQRFYSRFEIDPSRKEQYTSASSRVEIWKESSDLLGGYWLTGCGTGDIKDVLVKHYESNDFDFAASRKLNTHNQYLQTWLSVGISGFILLLALLLVPIIKGHYRDELSLLFFPLVIGLNALTESVLETQKGVLLFAFFYSIFYGRLPSSGKHKPA